MAVPFDIRYTESDTVFSFRVVISTWVNSTTTFTQIVPVWTFKNKNYNLERHRFLKHYVLKTIGVPVNLMYSNQMEKGTLDTG